MIGELLFDEWPKSMDSSSSWSLSMESAVKIEQTILISLTFVKNSERNNLDRWRPWSYRFEPKAFENALAQANQAPPKSLPI